MKTQRTKLSSRRKTWRSRDFPYKKGVSYSKLRMTPEGEYSMTKRSDGDLILAYMKTILKRVDDKHITDLTGNVGSDTILFGLHFKKVDSIELNPENYDVLIHNVKVFNLPNVHLHKGDSTKLFNWKTDVLYIDPPWGGPEYKTRENIDLYLGDVRVDEYVHTVLQRPNRPEYVFLKVPRNYAFNRFPTAKKYKVRGFYILVVK
jgi:predicted RNA methylase